MSACKGMTQYNDGCRAFLAFAVSNCTATDSKIYYPCKSCRNNQRHPPDYVLAHLTEGRGMSPRYILWYMHGKTRISGPVPGRYSNHVAADATARSTEHGGGTEQGGSTEQGGDMHAMLRDAFGMHDVREDINSQPHGVNEGAAGGDSLKYYELLRTAEKLLHPGTKHSKLSTTIHMYNLK
jgi:hypothetical protein